MDGVLRQAESDQEGLDSQDIFESADDRNRSARIERQGFLAERVGDGLFRRFGGNKPGFINSPKDTGDSPWPELSITGLSAPVDSDGDGIPDEWEIKNGLDPNNPVDGNTKTKDPNGQYTNLEVYLNSLVQHIVDAQNK